MDNYYTKIKYKAEKDKKKISNINNNKLQKLYLCENKYYVFLQFIVDIRILR